MLSHINISPKPSAPYSAVRFPPEDHTENKVLGPSYWRLEHILAGFLTTVEPLIMDTPKSRQPPYNGQTVRPLPIYCPYISTSEEGTTSKQWTKCSSPTCPLFGGSTVYRSVISSSLFHVLTTKCKAECVCTAAQISNITPDKLSL